MHASPDQDAAPGASWVCSSDSEDGARIDPIATLILPSVERDMGAKAHLNRDITAANVAINREIIHYIIYLAISASSF